MRTRRESCIVPASAKPRSPAACRSVAPPFAGFWRDLFLGRNRSTRAAIGLANLFIEKRPPDALGKIPAFRLSHKQLIILIRREPEIAIDLAAMEPYKQLTLVTTVCHRSKHTRIHRHPVHGLAALQPFSLFLPSHPNIGRRQQAAPAFAVHTATTKLVVAGSGGAMATLASFP